MNIFYDVLCIYVELSVVRNQLERLAESFKRHEEENTEKATVERWKEPLKKGGEISGYHLQNDFNGFEAKSVLKDNFVGLETRVGYVGKLLTQEPDDVQFIGILGTRGIGKTTIAMVVFNKFSSQFEGACYLDDVKEHKITELQEALVSRILNKKMGISNEVDGMEKIAGGLLRRKKVLIVLDDVDQVEQLQKLAGRRDWFRKGSRVIITTIDAGVLRSHGVDKKYVYEVHTLEYQKAIQLFSCYAFKSEIPATGFQRLSGLIVHYCNGLPLVLKVLGSSLCGLEVTDWESTLEQLKDTRNDDIHGKLKISFDRLDSKNKKIFLHIACFFRHEEEKRVKEALNALQPGFLGMRVLIEKSFISVQNGRIKMHDLLQEMGWRIARDEKPRSRVWEFKEVDDVFCGKMDPKHIECIVFPYTCRFRWQNDKNISNAFEALKILIGKRSYNEEEDNNFDSDVIDNYQLPSSLELIHFPYYPFSLLPTSFYPSGMDHNPLELAVISSHRCSLKNCRISEKLNKLTYLNLSSSRSLLETPDFDMMPNLEKLYLSGCEKLVKIHSSVGYLKKLVLLDLSYCGSLRRLPRFIQVSSLQFLKLEYCSKLRKFPEIQTNMPLVLELNLLQSIWIRELPSSIGQLRGLTKLCLCMFKNLVSLSDDLCELESLKILELRDCGQLKSLPEKLGKLSKLEELHVFETAIFQLPSSITQLSSLECLCWGGNLMFKIDIIKFLPSVSGLCSLKRLQLSNFKSIDEGLPSDLGRCLISLEYLNLNGSNFGYLPESFSQLPHLQYLDITHCEELEKLPELPATIRELYANSNLASESNMIKLATKYPKLYSISFPHRDKRVTFSAVELARKFAHAPFQPMRNSSFIVTYPIGYCSTDRDMTKWFKYSSHHSNKISISLKSSWHNQSFVGFVVCFILKSCDGIWKSCQEGRPFRYGQVKAQLIHKDNAANEEVLQTNCDFGRLCDEESYNLYKGPDIICFAYIPFLSLFNNILRATPSDYLVFEVGFGDTASNATTDWSCGLLYKNDESLSEAIWSKTSSNDNGDLAAEKKTSKRPAAMKIDEVEARLKEKDPTATIRLQKGSTIVPDLLSADSMVSKALEKAAAVTSTSSPAAPNRESQINIVDSDEAVGLENMLAGIVSTDLVLAINPGNSNLHTDLSVLDSSCMEEDYADEFFIIKSLRSACAITERLLDKKRHLKNELNEERFRVTELEARNKELVDQLEKEKHQLTLLVQTYQARATQAEVPNSDLLLALNNLLERYGTLEKQQLQDKQHYKKLEQLEEYVAKESNAGHGVKVAMSEHNDSVNKEEEEGEEDKQRKKARLDNKDKVAEDIIINSGKQNKGKNEQIDGRGELLATNDVFQRLGNDCKQLYNLLREVTMEYNMECIDVELDANIFHHKNMKRIFVMIENIKDLFIMNWLDVSIIQVFIMYLYQLCKEYEVSSIGFMCPTQIAKANVDMNLKAVIEYLRNTISKLQDKTFILAPYHQINHWLLLVICTSSRIVYVLDPMQCDRDLKIKPVLNMVFRTFTNQQGQRDVDWKNIKCPRQPGDSECGYYVMRYMYDICRKYFANTLLDEAFQEIEAYSDKEIEEICNMWAKHFLKECV